MQNAWMVCTLRPPGESNATANSRRARASRAASGLRWEIARDGGRELRVVERSPAAQLLEHAVRHVGGGGFGEGDAEYLGGIDAFEQQPDDALRQDVRLA